MNGCKCAIPKNALKCLDEFGFVKCIEHINAIIIKCKAPMDIIIMKNGYEDKEIKFGYFECKLVNGICRLLTKTQRDDFVEWVEYGKDNGYL